MIEVLHDRLADGLEDGIGESRTMFASVAKSERLRAVACGLANTAVHRYAKRSGLDSRLLISRGRFDINPDDAHVLTVVDDMVIDAAYSFIFSYVGMSWQYMHATKEADIFPAERILLFAVSEQDAVIRGLAGTAYAFRLRNRRPKGIYDEDVGAGLLADKNEEEIIGVYQQIYDLDRYDEWTPPERVWRDAGVVAAAVPDGCLTVY